MCRKPVANEYLELTSVWDNTEKEVISDNIKRIFENYYPECKNSFNAIWNKIVEITNSNKHTVYAWLNRGRNNVKVPLLKLCMIAEELHIDVLEFFKMEEIE